MTPRPARSLLRQGTAAAAALLLLVAPHGAQAGRHRKVPRSEPAPATDTSGTLVQRLTALARRPPIGNAREFSVVVTKLGETQPIIDFNGETPLILASTTKLFTTAAALDRLGTGYTFKTRLYRDADVQPDGVLPGHLVVVGGGDPAISGRLYDDDPLAVFQPWADSLKTHGIGRVRDGLILDTSFFDDVKVHPDWPADQEQNWWQAPVSALSYNDNIVLVRATGSVRPGSPALLGFYPAGPPLLSIIGRVVTAAGGGARVGVRRVSGSRTVVAAGIVGRNRTWMGDVTVPDPALYLAAGLSQVLRQTGIEVSGAPKLVTEPPKEAGVLSGRVLLHTHETPILPAMAICNKRSQSFYAEQFLKTLGAERRGLGTWTNGSLEVSDFLKSLGLDASRYQLVDGSGRSRGDRASAEAYIAFLQALATRWDKFESFKQTLAIPGDREGSLRHRMLGAATRGNVFAKTGYISGVVSLCGYVNARSGQTYTFAILINGGCPEWRGHEWQDRFVTELAMFG